MANDPVPEIVREFIVDNIDSIAELEALLLMRRDPDARWSTDALAERLYITREQTAGVTAKLCSLELAAATKDEPPAEHYLPSTPALDRVVGSVAETYSKYLIPVTNLIHSKPQSKVQQFADAFKVRKRRDE